MAGEDFSSDFQIERDATFQQQIQRLHTLTVVAQWSIIALLWMCLAPISMWGLRSEIDLWRDSFTWTAVRYGLAYNPLPTFGLALCIGMTVTVLIWQSHTIAFGISQRQIKRLERQLLNIRQQGKSHPLWKWVCEKK